MLEAVRLSLRLTVNDFDTEILDLIGILIKTTTEYSP